MNFRIAGSHGFKLGFCVNTSSVLLERDSFCDQSNTYIYMLHRSGGGGRIEQPTHICYVLTLLYLLADFQKLTFSRIFSISLISPGGNSLQVDGRDALCPVLHVN
jgi:hypothetical protein